MGWKTKDKYIICDECGRNSEVSQYSNRCCEHCGAQVEIWPSLLTHAAEGVAGGALEQNKKNGWDYFETTQQLSTRVKRKHRTIHAINEGTRFRVKYASGR